MIPCGPCSAECAPPRPDGLECLRASRERLTRKFGRKVFNPLQITLDCDGRATRSLLESHPLEDSDAPADLLWYAAHVISLCLCEALCRASAVRSLGLFRAGTSAV